jgi:hypothetical protein
VAVCERPDAAADRVRCETWWLLLCIRVSA